MTILSQKQITDQALQDLLADTKQFHYPFGETVQDFFRSQESIPIFTYGSLLNEASALRTIRSDVYDARVPSIAFGFKRIFNRDVDVTDSIRYTTPKDKKERGMLNLLPTKDNTDIVNGFVFHLDIDGISAMCEREVGYDLVPCGVVPWDRFKDEGTNVSDPMIAYTFLAPNESRAGICPVSNDIKPIKEYFNLVKDGAAQYGEDFLDHWYATTILADGKTTIAQWEAKLSTK